MNTCLVLFMVLLATIGVPAVIMRAHVRKVLNKNIPKEEKMYLGTKGLMLCLLLSVGIYFGSIIPLGILQKTMDLVSAHIGNAILGSLVFMMVLIFPVIISLMLLVLIASRIEVEVKGINVTSTKVAKSILLVFGFMLLPAVIWLGIYAALPETIKENDFANFAVFALYILAFFALAPYLTRIFSKPRPVPEPLRTDLLKFCESLGFKVRDIRVTGKKEYRVANAGVTGIIPGHRYIFVTEYMLETFEPEEIKAVIAHEVGHIKGRHLWINAMIAIGWFGFWTGIVLLLAKLNVDLMSPAVFFGVFFPAYVVYFVIIQGKVSLRNEFKADEFASKVVGKETVIRTLEKLAEVNLTPKRTGRWFSFLSMHPSIEERVKHLKELSG